MVRIEPIDRGAGGHWLQTATTANTLSGKITWHGLPRRAYAAMVGERCVATVRKALSHSWWQAKLEGWVWDVTPDMGSAQLGLGTTSVKGFRSRVDAQKAIESAWAVPRSGSEKTAD